MGARGWAVGAALAAVLTAGALGAAAAPAQEKVAKPRVEDLAWLAGTWRAEDGHGGFHEEHWMAPESGGMAGVFRSVEGGSVGMYEILAIETREGGNPVMFLRHFHVGLEPWKTERDATPSWPLRSMEKGKAVFENEAAKFPRTITYRLADEATLEVRLEGAPGSTKPPLEFKFKKTK